MQNGFGWVEILILVVVWIAGMLIRDHIYHRRK